MYSVAIAAMKLARNAAAGVLLLAFILSLSVSLVHGSTALTEEQQILLSQAAEEGWALAGAGQDSAGRHLLGLGDPLPIGSSGQDAAEGKQAATMEGGTFMPSAGTG